MNDVTSRIALFFERWGSSNYDEQISQLEHAVQCARLAHQNGADDELVVSALLHDIGHLLELENSNGSVVLTSNDSHESTGAAFLARYFPASVTAPIALHVEAKRYLCTTEESYYSTLSAGSVRSLALQGGLMDQSELERFRNHPAADRAVKLRRWDEQAKAVALSGLTFEDFREDIMRVLGKI